jgi:hypothetical protein
MVKNQDTLKDCERVVAFIDILGFKQLVKGIYERNDMKLRDILYDALKMESVYAEITNKGLFGVRDNTPFVQSTAFSDCIVISDEFEQVERIILCAATLAGFLLRNEIICRGGIATGKTIHDDRVLIGMGVINAHEIEQIAVYPRIVIQDDLVQRVKGSFTTKMIRDSDGLWFIDIFEQLKIWGEEGNSPGLLNLPEGAPWPDIEAFRNVRDFIIRNLKETRPNARVYMKYLWLANRFNEATNEYAPGEIEPIAF